MLDVWPNLQGILHEKLSEHLQVLQPKLWDLEQWQPYDSLNNRKADYDIPVFQQPRAQTKFRLI